MDGCGENAIKRRLVNLATYIHKSYNSPLRHPQMRKHLKEEDQTND